MAELLKVGEAPRNESLNAIEHAAYTSLCTLILNLDEVLTREQVEMVTVDNASDRGSNRVLEKMLANEIRATKYHNGTGRLIHRFAAIRQ